MRNIFKDNIFNYRKRRCVEEGLDTEELRRAELGHRGFEAGREPVSCYFSIGEHYYFFVHENQEAGVIDVSICDVLKDQDVVNFKDFVPEGYKFVSPKMILSEIVDFDEKTRTRMFNARGTFFVDSDLKWIGLGQMSEPKDIAALLHEIGHARRLAKHPELLIKLPMSDYAPLDTHEVIRLKSENERGAWAEALLVARKIEHEHGVNLLEAFKTNKELFKFINTYLAYYRFGSEPLLNKGLFRLFKFVFGFKPDKDELAFMKKLFDKGKLDKG